MSEKRYTLGLLEVRMNTSWHRPINVVDEHGSLVCFVNAKRNAEDFAKLFAAAPLMVEALEWCCAQCEKNTLDDGMENDCTGCKVNQALVAAGVRE